MVWGVCKVEWRCVGRYVAVVDDDVDDEGWELLLIAQS
jgi:hypothetical protein